jgi:uncharacterized protein (TIRG00374 family)
MIRDFKDIEMGKKAKKNVFLLVRIAVSAGLIAFVIFTISRPPDLAELEGQIKKLDSEREQALRTGDLLLADKINQKISLLQEEKEKQQIPVLRRLLAYFSDANYLYLLGACLLLLVLIAGGSFRWGILLSVQGIKLKPTSVYMYYMIGYFFNNFLPTTVGGDAVKIYYLSKFTRKGTESFMSILMDRIMGMVGLCLVAIAALLFGGKILWANIGFPDALYVFVIIGGLSIGLLAFFLIVFNERIMNIFLKLMGRGKVGEKIGKLHQAVYIYKGREMVLGQALLLSVFIWVVIIIIAWMVYLTFYPRIPAIPIGYFFLFIPSIGVIMSLPISIAGAGTREAAFILFFQKVPGVTDTDALIISLTYYFVFLAASVVGGIIYVLKDQLHFHREEVSIDD